MRKSNWELLRILAMLAIVSGHFFAQTGFTNIYGSGYLFYIAEFLGGGSRIAVQLFLLLGVWFMVDSQFKAKRVIRLYAQYFYYAFFIVLMLILLGYRYQLTLGNMVTAIFPYSFGPWFVTIYIGLILLSPYLKRVLSLNRIVLRNLIIILFILIAGISTIHKMADTYLDALSWFCFTYLFIGYYKKYMINFFDKYTFWKILFVAFSAYSFMIMFICIGHTSLQPIFIYIGKIFGNWLGDYKSIPNFIIAFMFFISFQKIDIGSINIVNKIAKSALAVYLIHQGPGIIKPLWFDFFQCDIFLQGEYPLLYSIGVILSVYIIASCIDVIRIQYIEPAFLKSRLFYQMENRLDNFYKNN